MKSKLLLPAKFRIPGLALLLVSVTGICFHFFGDYEPDWLQLPVFAIFNDMALAGKSSWFSVINDNIFGEICSVGIIVGGLMYAFARLNEEDEFTTRMRLDSLMTATYISYGFLLFGVMFIYGFAFLNWMAFHMFSLIIIFIIHFRFSLWKWRKSSYDEE